MTARSAFLALGFAKDPVGAHLHRHRELGSNDQAETNRQLTSDLDTFGDATRRYEAVANIGDKAAHGHNNEVGPQGLVYVAHGVMYTISVQVSGDPVKDEMLNETLAGIARN